MNFVTSVFKKYINKDEAKTQKNPKTLNDAPGTSAVETSEISGVKETNNLAPASENQPQDSACGSAPLSDEDDCFQDAEPMPSNITNKQNSLLILEAPSNRGSKHTKKVESLFENENNKDLDTIDNSMVKSSEPQKAPVKSPINTFEVFHSDDYQSFQRNEKAGEAVLNAEVNQAGKFVSLNDILFDSSYNLDTQLPREDLKPQNEARSALEVLIQNVNEALVCTTNTTKNNEETRKEEIVTLVAQEIHLEKENSKPCKDEEVESQKRKCEDVEELVKKLKTDKYPDFVGVQKNIENQNAPDKIVSQFVIKPDETQNMDICKIQFGENIQFNEITHNNKIKESNNNAKEIVELKPEAASIFPEENKIEIKTEIEINSPEQITKTTKEQGEDNQGTNTSVLGSKQNTEIPNEMLKEDIDVDLRLFNENDNDNIKAEEPRKNMNKELIGISNIENINDTFVEHKNKEDKLQQEGDLVYAPLIQENSVENVMPDPNKSSLEIQNQHAQRQQENLVPQKKDVSSNKELVHYVTNSESINKANGVTTTLKREGNDDDTHDLVNSPMTQEDSSNTVMLEQNMRLVDSEGRQARANLGSLVTQKIDLHTTKELSNSFENSDDINKTSINEISLKQERNKEETSDFVNALKIRKDSSEKLMMEQNKSLVEIEKQQAHAGQESSVTQKKDLSPIKELFNSFTNSDIHTTSINETSSKQGENEGETSDFVAMIREDSSENLIMEQNRSLVEIEKQQAQASLERLVTQKKDLSPRKELFNSLANSDIINLSSDKETSLEREGHKGNNYELVDAHMIQQDSYVPLVRGKCLMEIQNQEVRAKLGGLEAREKHLSSIKKDALHSSENSQNVNSDELLKQEGNTSQDTCEDFANPPIIIEEDSSVKVVLEPRSMEVIDSNNQDDPELSRNQDIQIQENLNTETDAKSIQLEQPQAKFKFGTSENNEENLVRIYSEEVIVCAQKSIPDSDLTKEENYEQNLQKPNALECEKLVKTIQNYLGKPTKEDEQLMSGKTFDRQDTKEFEKLERECKLNYKSDTTIDEQDLMHKTTNFGTQETQEFENLEKNIAINERKSQSITDDILDELVAESKTDNKVCLTGNCLAAKQLTEQQQVCLKLLEKNETEDDQCVITPDQTSQSKTSSFQKIKETDAEIAENEKTFFRQDTLEFEKLEKQCTDVVCLDVLDELVSQSTSEHCIGNAERIESVKKELVSVSTPCKGTIGNALKETIEENRNGQEEAVLEARQQENKTTFLKIHLQNKNAGKNQDETKSSTEKDDNGENKLLRIQVRSVNKIKQQNVESPGVECQKEVKYTTVDKELKSKVDDLQLELDSIRKMNRRKEKCISTSKVEMKESENVISKYKNVIKEYEKHIVQQNSDLEKLKIENDRNMRHFTNTEMAFSDVFEKYEKAKYVIAAYAKNEDILLENLQNAEEQLTKTETKCVTMKKQSFEQIKRAKHHVEQAKQKYNQEIAKLQGQIKRLEIKATSLEVALKQKTDECQALASLCDDITGRHSNST